MWGRVGGLWLGKGDGGVRERDLEGALVGQEQRGEAAATYINWLKICMDPPLLPPFQTLEDKGERDATVEFRPEV
jgi:hypothetical protein